MTIELDTQDAKAKLDDLEEKLDELNDDINDQEGELSKNEKKAHKGAGSGGGNGSVGGGGQGGQPPSLNNTGPGKFGVRNIPAILTAADMAGFIGGMIPLPAVGSVARKLTELEQQYGPLAQGMVEGTFKQFGVPDSIAKAAVDSAAKAHKLIADMDKRLKAITPTIENTLEMAKAQIMSGGHVNADQLVKFAQTDYEWEFVNQRKTQDIRDKTLRTIGEEAPNVMKELFMRAMQGKMVP